MDAASEVGARGLRAGSDERPVDEAEGQAVHVAIRV
jgi:hypothetical protein